MLRDISLHIHDLTENSIAAGARLVSIKLVAENGMLTLEIGDNGKGMSPEMLSRVEDPFTTSRTERKVGMGIPFFKLACEQAGGDFKITSEPGKGTELKGRFVIDNIDRLPLGDIGETVGAVIRHHLVFVGNADHMLARFDQADDLARNLNALKYKR